MRMYYVPLSVGGEVEEGMAVKRGKMGRGQDGSRDLWQSAEDHSAFRVILGPLLLTVACPVLIFYLYICMVENDGALLWPTLSSLFANPALTPNMASAKFLLGLLALEATLLVSIPAPKFNGPRAPSGHIPTYRKNGFLCFWITGMVLGSLCYYSEGGFLKNAAFIYDNLGPLLTLLNLGAFVQCVALFVKGLYAPSNRDAGLSSNPVMSFFWGVELYPRVLGVDLKQLLICRFGMLLWSLFVLSFCAKTCVLNGTDWPPNAQLVSSSLMFFYVAKFYIFEPEYLCAADIAVDRFGFMLCWGTQAFMPMVHSLSCLFLVTHDVPLSTPLTVCCILVGNTMTAINYDSDTQRHRIRAAKGKCNVWGKPAKVIKASYTTLDGTKHTSLLSVCGYQGIVRHFHYVPDIINLFLYCAPCGFTHLLPFSYFIYLTALLIDRTFRIDERCKSKYGKYWDQYEQAVPYRLVPGVF